MRWRTNAGRPTSNAAGDVGHRTDRFSRGVHASIMFSLRPAILCAGLGLLDAGSAVGVSCDNARRVEVTMPTPLEKAARPPFWVAGIVAGLLAILGVVATVQPIPALYASVAGDSAAAPPARGAVSTGSGESLDARAAIPEADLAIAPIAGKRRSRANCPDCGVVESIRQSGRAGNAGRKGRSDLEVAVAEASPGGDASGAGGRTGIDYEITVRFRDGSRTVLSEASPRAWQAGSRVIVIGRADAASD